MRVYLISKSKLNERNHRRIYLAQSRIDALAMEFKWKVKRSMVDFKLKTFREVKK